MKTEKSQGRLFLNLLISNLGGESFLISWNPISTVDTYDEWSKRNSANSLSSSQLCVMFEI